MLRVLINRYSERSGNALLQFLPPDEQQAISRISTQSKDLTPILHPENRLCQMHSSWLKEIADEFPDRLKPALQSALEELDGKKGDITLSKAGKTFIISQLCEKLKIHDHLPMEYLGENEFSSLLKWTKKELVDLIDFLGLYDLASEVRQIVNKAQLTNIYSCLTSQQLSYLKICLRQKEELITPKLGIDHNKQDCPKLKQTIQRRGLSRLGKAFIGQQDDFVWTIARILDMGRGNIILNEYHSQTPSKIASVLKQQVLNVMNFLKNG